MPTLSVLTYNTWKCDGNYPQRIQDIRQQISSTDFDLLLLQEVFKSEDGQYDTLAELIPPSSDMHTLFHPGRKKTRRVNGKDLMSASGLAIVSRLKVKQNGVFQLPVDDSDRDRYCQWCVIETLPQDILIINTHLTHIHNQHALRNTQFQALIEFVHSGKHLFAVIGGDMNTSPQQLASTANLNCVFKTDQPNTLNTSDSECLDHLYLYSKLDNSPHWGQYRLLLDQKQSGDYYLSDHKAVFAELIL